MFCAVECFSMERLVRVVAVACVVGSTLSDGVHKTGCSLATVLYREKREKKHMNINYV